jgi:hypothetical protein
LIFHILRGWMALSGVGGGLVGRLLACLHSRIVVWRHGTGWRSHDMAPSIDNICRDYVVVIHLRTGPPKLAVRVEYIYFLFLATGLSISNLESLWLLTGLTPTAPFLSISPPYSPSLRLSASFSGLFANWEPPYFIKCKRNHDSCFP